MPPAASKKCKQTTRPFFILDLFGLIVFSPLTPITASFYPNWLSGLTRIISIRNISFSIVREKKKKIKVKFQRISFCVWRMARVEDFGSGWKKKISGSGSGRGKIVFRVRVQVGLFNFCPIFELFVRQKRNTLCKFLKMMEKVYKMEFRGKKNLF